MNRDRVIEYLAYLFVGIVLSINLIILLDISSNITYSFPYQPKEEEFTCNIFFCYSTRSVHIPTLMMISVLIALAVFLKVVDISEEKRKKKIESREENKTVDTMGLHG